MVVTHPEAGSSAFTKKKTRRKMGKKPNTGASASSSSANAQLEGLADLNDEEMDETSTVSRPDISTVPIKDNNIDKDDNELMIDNAPTDLVVATGAPYFPPLSAAALKADGTKKSEMRRIQIPPHRMTPLKKDWINIFAPLTEMMGLQVRMNVQRKCVEIRVRYHLLLPVGG